MKTAVLLALLMYAIAGVISMFVAGLIVVLFRLVRRFSKS